MSTLARVVEVAMFSDLFTERPVDQGPKRGKSYNLEDLIKESLNDVPEWTIEGCIIAFCNEAVRRADLNKNGWSFESQYNKQLCIDEHLPEILSKMRTRPDCQVSNKEGDKITVPVLVVEVNSSPFIQTLRQTSIQLMNILRYLRNLNLGISEYSGFAFPKLADKTHTAKVTVKWVQQKTKFTIVVDPLEAKNVMEEMVKVLRSNFDVIQNLPPEPPNRLIAIPLSGLPKELKQIPSNYSLLLENENYFFKYPLESSSRLILHDLKDNASHQREEANRKTLQTILALINDQQMDSIENVRKSLSKMQIPESNDIGSESNDPDDPLLPNRHKSDSEIHHQLHYLRPLGGKYALFGVEYFKFPKLLKPLTEEQARECLKCFGEGVFAAIKQLHEHGYAHLDIRLANICIDPATFEPVLIDLDRGCKCKEKADPEKYSQSCMYDLPGAAAENYDWRQFGLMLDWIQNDRRSSNKSYHVRKDLKKISDPFILKLLEGEVPDQFDWACKSQLTIEDVIGHKV